jgi:steroid delta-isomerase
MLSQQVSLRDWSISAQGKDAALEETRKNFGSVQDLKIVLLRVYE